MKNLIENINEQLFETFMFDVNDSIINESLESSYLTTIAKQLKSFGSKNKNGIYWQNSFSGVFGRLDADWSKIKDSDFEEYKAGDKAGIKKVRNILSSKTGWVNAIVLLKSSVSDEFNGMICWRGKTDFNGRKWDYEKHDYTKNIEQYDGYLQKYAKEDCEKMDFLYLDLSKFSVVNIKQKRGESKANMVLQGDPNYYYKLAQENKERYAKIIAKRKAERAAENDTISDDVKSIVDELMELSATAAKNPDKYVDVEYEIGFAIEEVYSTRRYDKGKSYGTNGLLYLYKNYITQHLSMVKDGGHNFQRNSQDNYKKEIEKAIERIKSRIEKIKAKIKE